VTCRIFHRWSEWTTEFEECPDGDMGVWGISTRQCKRRGCDYFEEVTRCVSLSPVVARGLTL
jgi:hypothetical protein